MIHIKKQNYILAKKKNQLNVLCKFYVNSRLVLCKTCVKKICILVLMFRVIPKKNFPEQLYMFM